LNGPPGDVRPERSGQGFKDFLKGQPMARADGARATLDE
jgi:hypothetical protein